MAQRGELFNIRAHALDTDGESITQESRGYLTQQWLQMLTCRVEKRAAVCQIQALIGNRPAKRPNNYRSDTVCQSMNRCSFELNEE